jgi:hypothetical protein
MSVMAMTTSAAAATSADWAIVCGLCCVLIWALMHWRFKSGWQMTSGRMVPSPSFFPTYVCMLYAALPFTIGSVGLTTGLVLGRFDLTSKSWVWADLMLLALTALLAGAGWGVKEFFSPTRSRTPAWLVENGY